MTQRPDVEAPSRCTRDTDNVVRRFTDMPRESRGAVPPAKAVGYGHSLWCSACQRLVLVLAVMVCCALPAAGEDEAFEGVVTEVVTAKVVTLRAVRGRVTPGGD